MYNNYFNDLLKSILNFNNWFTLSWFDVKLKYRRTKLGPLWNVLTILLTVCLLSLVWGIIFKMNLLEYLPRLYCGMTAWTLVSAATAVSSSLFSGMYSHVIRNLDVNPIDFILRHISSTFINYLHFVPLILIFILFFPTVSLNFNTVLVIPGLLLVMMNMVWMSYLFAVIGSRFRDVIPLTESVISAGSLMTPIIWPKSLLGEYENWIYLNPFTFFVEAVRDPLLGKFPGIHVYIGLLGIMIIGYTLVYHLHKRKKHRIVFWAS